MRARRIIAVACVLSASMLGLAAARAAWRAPGRGSHPPVPVLSDPSSPEPPPVEIQEGPRCAFREVARAGARVTALLVASDGALHVGTFDAGVLRLPPEGGDPVPVALSGRERFVNALAEHEGLVWVATQGGVVALDGERRVLALLRDDAVTALAPAGKALYAGTARGIFRASAEDGAVPVEAAGPSGEPLRVSALTASGGRLWIGTSSGAYSLALAEVEAPLLARTARWHPLVFGDPPARTNVVTALAPLAGGVVAGTDDGGAVRVREDGRVAASRLAEPRANEVNPGAAAALEGSAALLGTQGGGLLLVRASAAGLSVSRVADGEISAVHVPDDGGDALVGTAAGAVLAVSCDFIPGGRERPPGPPARSGAASPAVPADDPAGGRDDAAPPSPPLAPGQPHPAAPARAASARGQEIQTEPFVAQLDCGYLSLSARPVAGSASLSPPLYRATPAQ